MSLQEQIDEAWKEQCEKFSRASEERMFAAGYRAAMRGLYREVRPEDVKVGGIYTVLKSETWYRMDCMRINENLLMFYTWPHPRDMPAFDVKEADRIYIQNLPHPSEIFGEEGT